MRENLKNKTLTPLEIIGQKERKTKNHKFLTGFTLIELLVVIAVIGLLATIISVSVNSARTKSRDAQRIADLKQIQTALEMYYDTYNYYPKINYAYTTSDADGCGYSDRWCALETALSAYLSKLPRDPLGNQNNYRFFYDADSGDNYQTYGLMVRMEHSSNFGLVASDGGYYDPTTTATTGGNYEVGQQPAYCMGNAAYTGTNKNWWESGTNVCVGGN